MAPAVGCLCDWVELVAWESKGHSPLRSVASLNCLTNVNAACVSGLDAEGVPGPCGVPRGQ